MTARRCWIPWLVAALALATALTLAVVLVQRDREAKAERREAAANNAAAKAAFPAIAKVITEWMGTGEVVPAEGSVTKEGIWSMVQLETPTPWPTNPFTGKPMQPGRSPGDYEYVILDHVGWGDTGSPSRCMLQGYGSGGAVLYRVVVPSANKQIPRALR